METKELKIQIPEGYCIDESKSTFEKIVFKKIDTKPRSWEEYLKQYRDTNCYVLGFDISSGHWRRLCIYGDGYCTVPTKELTEAFLAMMQLMSLRQAWIGDWKPDWNDKNSIKFTIECVNNKPSFTGYLRIARPLSFPTKEMATDFMNCFKDLLEIAKTLI